MVIGYIAIAIVVALVLLTLLWGARRPAPTRRPDPPERRYGTLRGANDETDPY